MNKLEKAKQIIQEYYDEARFGIFDCRNTANLKSLISFI